MSYKYNTKPFVHNLRETKCEGGRVLSGIRMQSIIFCCYLLSSYLYKLQICIYHLNVVIRVSYSESQDLLWIKQNHRLLWMTESIWDVLLMLYISGCTALVQINSIRIYYRSSQTSDLMKNIYHIRRGGHWVDNVCVWGKSCTDMICLSKPIGPHTPARNKVKEMMWL